MTHQVIFSAAATKQWKKLRLSTTQYRLLERAIDALARNPHVGVPLRRELKGYYKLRVGDFRIVYEVRANTITVIIIAIGHRRNVYSDLLRRM